MHAHSRMSTHPTSRQSSCSLPGPRGEHQDSCLGGGIGEETLEASLSCCLGYSGPVLESALGTEGVNSKQVHPFGSVDSSPHERGAAGGQPEQDPTSVATCHVWPLTTSDLPGPN